ncbi:MAG: TonB family protein [Bacteroidia bacterium]
MNHIYLFLIGALLFGVSSTALHAQDTTSISPKPPISFSFGEGNTRLLQSLGYPIYRSEKEEVIIFEFVIAPEGHVTQVEIVEPANSDSTLRAAGIEAIMKWEFSPIPSDQPQTDKKAQVEIVFKLK